MKIQPDIGRMSAAEVIALLQPPKPKPERTDERIERALQIAQQGATSKAFWKEHTQDLIERWNAGQSTGVIAAAYGFRRDIVANRIKWLRKCGVDLRTSAPLVTLDEPKTTEHTDLIKRWNVGYSADIIADKYETTRSAVLGKVKRIRDSGVFMRSSPPLIQRGFRSRRNLTRVFWGNEENVNALIRRWNDGESAAVIGADFRLRRHLIISKVRSLRNRGVFMRRGRPHG